MLFLKYSLNIQSIKADGRARPRCKQHKSANRNCIIYPAHAIHCNTAVQCSSLWSTFGQSVSLSVSKETEHFQMLKTDERSRKVFLIILSVFTSCSRRT